MFLLAVKITYTAENDICVVPTDSMVITKDTILCSGTYNLPNGITIGANNITLECNNTVLRSQYSGIGIGIYGKNNTKIENCDITNYSAAIHMKSSSNNTIENNKIYLNKNRGISMESDSNNNLISNNWINKSRDGVYVYKSSYNLITHNNIFDNDEGGVEILGGYNQNAPYNVISYNNISDGGVAMYVEPNNIVSNNNIFNNLAVIYSASNCTIINNSIFNNSGVYGLVELIGLTSQNVVSGNNIYSNGYNAPVTVHFYGGEGNVLSGNNIYSNSNALAGIYLEGDESNNLIIINNNIYNNSGYNLQLSSDHTNDAILTNNYFGTTNCTEIDKTIYDDEESNGETGKVIFEPFLNESYPYGTPKNCSEMIIPFFDISLIKGWNLISLPIMPNDRIIGNIFKNYSKIFTYNRAWEEINNNSIVNETKAYWIMSLNNQTIKVEGKEFNYPMNISLRQGWNLISYPYLNETLVNETLKDINYSIIYYYNNSIWSSYSPIRNESLNNLKYLKLGYGYCVNSNKEGVLSFNPG